MRFFNLLIFLLVFLSSGTLLLAEPTPTLDWVRQVSIDGSTNYLPVKTDAAGNVYTLSLDSYPDTPTGFMELRKFDSLGNSIYAVSQEPSLVGNRGLQVTSSGDVYTVGTESSTSFSPGTGFDFDLYHSTPAGVSSRIAIYDNGPNDYAQEIVISGGQLWVAGSTNGPGGLEVATFSMAGSIINSWMYPSSYNALGAGAAVAPAGGIYAAVCGRVPGFLSQRPMQVYRLDASGGVVWQTALTSTASPKIGMNSDSAGNLYLAGTATDSGGILGMELWKFDVASGAPNLVTRVAHGIADRASYVQVDSLGNLFLGGAIQTSTGWDYDLEKLSSSGSLLWELRGGIGDYNSVVEIALSPSENEVYFTTVSSTPSTFQATLYLNAYSQVPLTVTPVVIPPPPVSVAPLAGTAFIFPSPVRGKTVNLAFNMKGDGHVKIVIRNEAGNVVATIEKAVSAGAQTISIPINNFAVGVYLYQVFMTYDSGGQTTIGPKKFVVAP